MDNKLSWIGCGTSFNLFVNLQPVWIHAIKRFSCGHVMIFYIKLTNLGLMQVIHLPVMYKAELSDWIDCLIGFPINCKSFQSAVKVHHGKDLVRNSEWEFLENLVTSQLSKSFIRVCHFFKK